MTDAATRMIDAAERIAAERGLAATTIQAVQHEAEQRNKSAVQYHFGDRQGLLDAVVRARMAPASDRRTEMLLELGADASIRDLVAVLVVPLVESVLARRPSYWARFLLQTISDPSSGPATIGHIDDRALQVAQARLLERLDHLPPSLRQLRVQAVFGYACVVLAAHEVGNLPKAPSDVLATELVDACCGLVTAPSTAPHPEEPSHG